MIEDMEREVFHISSVEAIRNIASILERVEQGAEVIVERDQRPVAVIQLVPRPGRFLSESLGVGPGRQPHRHYIACGETERTSCQGSLPRPYTFVSVIDVKLHCCASLAWCRKQPGIWYTSPS